MLTEVTRINAITRGIMNNENKHGHNESMKVLRLIIKHIKNGLFVLRSIELKKEMVGNRNWRLVIYMEEK